MPSRDNNRILQSILAIVWFNVALMFVERDTFAADPGPSVEQLAMAIDSADGLLATLRPQKFLGARSCAASACHGGIDPDPRFPLSRRNEYVHWLDQDPHSRSFQTLESARSKAILQRLSRSTDSEAVRASRLANCYGCHNPQPDQSRRGATYYERDSVSCEVCHGASEQWIGPHVTQAWPGLKQTGDAAALGFVETENISIRAKACAQCHVGSAGREVNHDLIAAGHPALKFEMTAYHAMLPKHWRDEEERKSNSQLEIALWKDGQVACGEAAINLLAWRASRAKEELPDAVWPEFAEYDCYACHHDLVHPSWRQTNSTSGTPLGMPAWGSWYFSRLMSKAGEDLPQLAKQMQGSFRPDPASIVRSVDSVQLAVPKIDALVALPSNWDDATQQYLALVAMEQAQRDSGKIDDSELTASITSLRQRLAFPQRYDSPKGLFEQSEPGATRGDVHKSLSELMNQLLRRGEQ
ncbi:MAG: hypothetical protein H8E66_06515 [Planctomycetes bacterium]|nr:hypothetical protein [Planctomycetota bacterium]